MRGERRLRIVVFQDVDGSSPHARGTHDLAGRQQHLVRFIPACAGNAWIAMNGQHQRAVHPRMRGERSRFMNGPDIDDGSSPHARGTLPRKQI